ncbi:phosphohydrolase [Clostridium aceticum]|uniref:Phosphohydrolase n=1 Tax=Clostridium aceticum TaxID=84022 RepID=A0A0D8IBR0_9CLOT|nr:metallophosphoesterase [Clostridium aceticum]AKL96255.1 phosphohydrolase [Clostridium aceticum]KJF26661.1 serine/threonine protein phosphatase [Clostridium aceticum]
MALYAIGDLHLSSKVDKPMDIFGPQWTMHHEKIREDWCKKVKSEDTVLIPGDISWGMNMEEAMEDLNWIETLPGEKILLKGNHDYWWGSIKKLNNTFKTLKFLQNNFFAYEDYAICGTRGWSSPNSNKFTQQDEKIYHREVHRLKLSLEGAKKSGYTKIICMLHYPPTNEQHEPSLFTEICEEYNVHMVIYGHLHGEEFYDTGIKGLYNGIHYHLVSCDYLKFQLYKIF